MNYQSKQPPPLPAWPLRRLRKYRPRGAVPRSVVLRSFLDRYLGSAAQTHRWRCLINVIASRCGREQVRRNFSVTDVPWRTHSGGRSSPLTSCMPSRDPGKSSIMKPRITSRHTEAVVVTRGVLRGLVWLELLPRRNSQNSVDRRSWHDHAATSSISSSVSSWSLNQFAVGTGCSRSA
jgi:hypothetical protein